MRFGSYELIEILAKGGMAEVFRARRRGAEGFVKELAIKRILPGFANNDEFVRLFINEARLAAELSCHNIVQIHDFDHVDGAYYIAMELIEGRDLRRVLTRLRDRGRSLSIPLGLFIVGECLKGLLVAHEKRGKRGEPLDLIHRDVSPHNILVSFTGEVKLTDFGIAKAAVGQYGTSSDVIRGKLPYMSPEQISGQPLDARSDLFSLGIVLFELLCGRRLYHAQGPDGILVEVARARIPDPAKLNAAISPGLRRVILRFLSKDVEQRFSSARQVLDALMVEDLLRDRRLELAELMEQLFPAEARSAQRAKRTIVTAADDAPLAGHLLRKETRSADDLATTAPARSPARDPSADRDPSPRPAGAAVGARRRIAILLVAVLLSAGAVTWLTVNRLARPRGLPSASHDDRTAGAPAATNGTADAMAQKPRVTSASVLVLTDPAGAQVLVDGLPTGQRSPASFGIRLGRHRIGARFPNGALVEREELFAAGQHRKIRLRRPTPTRAGAARRPRDRPRPRPRPHGAARPDPRPREITGDPARPRPAPRPPRTRRGGFPSRVSFVCSPWAHVRFQGRRIGQTLVHLRLSAGRYSVRFDNFTLQKRQRVSFHVRGEGRPLRVDCGIR